MNDQALINFAKKQIEIATLQLNATKIFLETTCAESVKSDNELNWVYIEKLADLTGLSINAIRNRVSRKEWIEGTHYRRENENSKKSRLIFDIKKISTYLSGKCI